MSNEEAWIALVGTLLGGSGLKLVEGILGRNRRRDDTASSLRTELRTDLSGLRLENHQLQEKVDELEVTIDEWRDKYYKLVAQLARRGIRIEDE